MISAVGLQASWHVLDASCGSGSFLPLMANLIGPSGRLTAIDLAPEHVAAVEVLVKSGHFPCPIELHSGTLLLDVPMSIEPPQAGSSFVSLFLWASNGEAAHSFELYNRRLKAAGFREVKQLGERWLSAIK